MPQKQRILDKQRLVGLESEMLAQHRRTWHWHWTSAGCDGTALTQHIRSTGPALCVLAQH